MITKKILSFILTACVVTMSFSSVVQASAKTGESASNQVAQVTSEIDGSAQTASRSVEISKQFTIRNKDDFSKFMTTSDYWGSNYKITLESDIDMQGATFKPIKEFSGKFDGCGHTISNLKLENQSNKDDNVELALINTLNEYAEIKNVTLNNYTVKGNSKVEKAAGFVVSNKGNISGVDIKSGSISNINDKIEVSGFVVKNSGEITKSNTAMTLDKGGLAGGFVSENGEFGIIKECSAKEKVSGKICAGGFCGINAGELISCKSEGSVKAYTSSKKETTMCGGFIATNNGIIKNCSSSGEVEGQEFTGGFVGINGEKGYISLCKSTCCVKSETYFAFINCGGFVGVNSGKIENCELKGKVEKVESLSNETTMRNFVIVSLVSGIVVVGLIGALMPSLEIAVVAGSIGISAFCTADFITAMVAPMSLCSGNNAYVGGFCGYNSNEISKCSAIDVSISGKGDAMKSMFGGFVGENEKDGIIKDCNITGTGNGIDLGYYSGGFVGENKGKIENGTTTVSVYANQCAGGFCGNNEGELISCKSEGNAKADAIIAKNRCGGFVGENRGKVNDCTSKGSATGEEYVGGFCGDNTGEISKSRSEGNATASTKVNKNRCGGFVGRNGGIVKDSTSKGSATGQEYVGGFCGDNTGNISKSRSEGNAKASTKVNTNRCGGFVGENSGAVSDSTSTGSATGEEYVGGFVGLNKSNISGCNASGKATAKTKTHTALAGGFVGENEKGTITNCTATGGADSRSSSGQAKSGGFVGINNASIVRSKASGKVYLSAGTFRTDDGCGGFVGKNDQGGSIDGCYAEATVETTNKKKGGGFVGEAKSKSTIKNSQSKAKIVTKSGTKSNTKFCQNKDKKAVIENCTAN